MMYLLPSFSRFHGSHLWPVQLPSSPFATQLTYITTVPIVATAASALGIGAYLNAKFHIAHDLSYADNSPKARHAATFLESRIAAKRLLNFHVLEEQAQHQPDHPFLIFDAAGPRRREWTYAEFVADVRKVGNWLMKELGVEVGEIVGLYGTNTPEYLMLWFALDGIGACASFINCNLTSKSLVHCVKICDCRYLLCDVETKPLVEPSAENLSTLGVQTVYYDSTLTTSLSDSTAFPDSRTASLDIASLRSLIYTSGTTGFPKATQMRTGREILTGHNISRVIPLTRSSRMYTCMPLYHGAAHGLGVTPTIHAGGTIVLGRKFSHTRFWPEVRASQANIIQYVGELCRYLMNAPLSKLDREHSVQMAWGVGMRPDIWERFRERFGISVIHELYAATDGLGATFNANQGPFTRHAIALRGVLQRRWNREKEAIVKIDVDNGDEVVRDNDGWVVRCQTGEPGEMLYQMDQSLENGGFTGYYNNPEAGNKRMLRNVFKEGDLWFRSGDTMRQDSSGCLFFVDRLGDTFRWKSENVSTNEVSDVISAFPQIAEANVYGVAVPNADGRCGCAAITFPEGVSEETFDFGRLAGYATAGLPRYAVPIFLRLTAAIDYTGTLKMQKGRLKQEGVDVEKVENAGDKLYWLPPGDGTKYVRFKAEDLAMLSDGTVKL